MSAYYLIYTSKATSLMPVSELLALLEQSRTDNSLHNITGMLLYAEGRFLNDLEGRFIQLLEGSREDVKTLYTAIKRDVRHKRLLLLAEGEIPSRIFKDWTMGFRLFTLADHQKIPGYFELNDAFLTGHTDQQDHAPLNYLRSFYDINAKDNWRPVMNS